MYEIERGAFKQSHHGGEYAKGRECEFEAWRKLNYRSVAFIRFECAVRNRQDVAFDGCIPLVLEPDHLPRLPARLHQCPKSVNALDKLLYTLQRCCAATSLWHSYYVVRANTLWKFLYSERLSGGSLATQDGQARKLVTLQAKVQDGLGARARRDGDPMINIVADAKS